MPSASVLFYGRRSRSSRPFDDDLASTSSSDPTSSSHRHRKSSDRNRRHRHRHSNPHDSDHLRLPPTRSSTLPENEVHQRGCVSESLSGDTGETDAVEDMNRRYCRSNRLPGSVLLAKARLLERLRGVSISEVRQTRESSPSVHSDDYWEIDADWETSVFRENLAPSSVLTESPGVHLLSESQEPKKKPVGLTKETLSQLQHEIFSEQQIDSSHCVYTINRMLYLSRELC